MGLSFIGYHGTAAANNVATTNAIGDILIVRAYRTGNGTAPTLASGFEDLGAVSAAGGAASTQTASRTGWRVATAVNEGSGSWANANGVEVIVLRGQKVSGPIGNVNSAGENTTRAYIRYPAVTRTEATSWFVAFGSRLAAGGSADVATSPNDGTTTITNRGSVPATPYLSAHAAPSAGNWSSTDVSVGGTAYKYNGWVIEVLEEPPEPNEYDESVTGAVAPSGALDIVPFRARTFAGEVAPSGAVEADAFLARAFTGEMAPSGALSRNVPRDLLADLGLAASLGAQFIGEGDGYFPPAGNVADFTEGLSYEPPLGTMANFADTHRPTRFFDDFNRANGEVGPNYSAFGTFPTLRVFSNQARGNGASPSQYGSVVKASVVPFTADQKATVVVAALGSFDYFGLLVRANAASGNGYGFQADGIASSRRITRWTGNVGTVIGTVNINASAGDVFELRAVGTTISLYRNGDLVDSVTDATYASGQPGLYYRWENNGSTRLDDFDAENLGGEAPGEYQQSVSGSLGLAGAVARAVQRLVVGTFGTDGTLVRTPARVVSGSVAPDGQVARLAAKNRAFDGAVGLEGDLTRAAAKTRTFDGSTAGTGQLSAEAALSRVVSGELAQSGELLRQGAQAFSGAITPDGASTRRGSRTVAGTVGAEGEMARTPLVARAFEGTAVPSGTSTPQGQKALSGAPAVSGTARPAAAKRVSGATAPSGATTRRVARALSGAVTAAGTVLATAFIQVVVSGTAALVGTARALGQKFLEGAPAVSGAVARRVDRVLAHVGTVGLAALAEVQSVRVHLIAGGVTPAGDIATLSAIGRVLGGLVAVDAVIQRRTTRLVSGISAMSGASTRGSVKATSGSTTPSGTAGAVKAALVQLSGSTAPGAAVTRAVQKQFAATAALSGTTTRRTAKAFSGAAAPSGAVQRGVVRVLVAALSAAGIVVRAVTVSVALGSALGLSAVVRRAMTRSLAGTTTPSGTVTKRSTWVIARLLEVVGELVRFVIVPNPAVYQGRADARLELAESAATLLDGVGAVAELQRADGDGQASLLQE